MKFKTSFMNYVERMQSRKIEDCEVLFLTEKVQEKIHNRIAKEDVEFLIKTFEIPKDILINPNLKYSKKELKEIVMYQNSIFDENGNLIPDLNKEIVSAVGDYLHLRENLSPKIMVANKDIIDWEKYITSRKINDIHLPEEVLGVLQTKKYRGKKAIDSILLIHDIRSFA